MKKLALLIVVLALASIPASAKSIIDSSLPVNGLNITCGSAGFSVDMNLLTGEFKPSRNSEYVITPVLISEEGTDSVEFSSVIVAGRNLYYSHLREHNAGSTPVYYAGKQQEVAYSDKVPFQPWMYNAGLKIRSEQRGCCQTFVTEYSDNLARTSRVEYIPQFNYVQPVAEPVKEYDISGSAFVNFRLNKTALDIDYMTNRQELRKITASIDTVRMNSDATVNSIKLTGFASPEGAYANNERLAKGRTEAVKEYVRKKYDFPANLYQTASVAEDWDGLRDSVAASTLADRDAILALIDDKTIPVAVKNDRLRAAFPLAYSYLLGNVYPWLRHTNYDITFTIKEYDDIAEIMTVLSSNPGNLSLREFYLAANSLTAGSPEYDDVWLTAVLMYPEDPLANINAAYAYINRGDLVSAERHLAKAGSGADAILAKGVLEAKKGNYESASALIKEAQTKGHSKAAEALSEINRVSAKRDKVTYTF